MGSGFPFGDMCRVSRSLSRDSASSNKVLCQLQYLVTGGHDGNPRQEVQTAAREFRVACPRFGKYELGYVQIELRPTRSHQARVICWWRATRRSRLGHAAR
jgi:hypothetical protein